MCKGRELIELMRHLLGLLPTGGKKGFKGDEVREAGRGQTMKNLLCNVQVCELNMKAKP